MALGGRGPAPLLASHRPGSGEDAGASRKRRSSGSRQGGRGGGGGGGTALVVVVVLLGWALISRSTRGDSKGSGGFKGVRTVKIKQKVLNPLNSPDVQGRDFCRAAPGPP